MSEDHLKQISLIIFGIVALLAIVGVILLFAEESVTGDATRLARAAEKNKARQAQQKLLQQSQLIKQPTTIQQVAPVITPAQQPGVLGQPGCATYQEVVKGTRQVIYNSNANIPTSSSCASKGLNYNSALGECYSSQPASLPPTNSPSNMFIVGP